MSVLLEGKITAYCVLSPPGSMSTSLGSDMLCD